MGLHVLAPGAFRLRDVLHELGVLRVAHVHNGKAVVEHVADVGVAFGNHDLDAVCTASLIAVTKDTDVLCIVRSKKVRHFSISSGLFIRLSGGQGFGACE